MKKIALATVIAIGIILVFIINFGYGQSLYYAYRLNVKLNSPTGVISGSALYVTSAGRGRPLVTSSGPIMWGEAVVLRPEVGNPIFVSVPWVEIPRIAFNVNLDWEESKRGISIASKLAEIADGHSANLDPKNFPNMFTFGDVEDPFSARVLFFNPGAAPVDKIAETLGDGWSVSEINVEMRSIPSWPHILLGSNWASYWLRSHGGSDGSNISNRIKWIETDSGIRTFSEAVSKQVGVNGAMLGFGRSAFYKKGL